MDCLHRAPERKCRRHVLFLTRSQNNVSPKFFYNTPITRSRQILPIQSAWNTKSSNIADTERLEHEVVKYCLYRASGTLSHQILPIQSAWNTKSSNIAYTERPEHEVSHHVESFRRTFRTSIYRTCGLHRALAPNKRRHVYTNSCKCCHVQPSALLDIQENASLFLLRITAHGGSITWNSRL
jgi:hypothetical protein